MADSEKKLANKKVPPKKAVDPKKKPNKKPISKKKASKKTSPKKTESKKIITTPISAAIILFFVTVIFLTSVTQIILEMDSSEQQSLNVRKIFNGTYTEEFEDWLEGESYYLKWADQIWTSITYLIFRTTKDKLVFGKGKWLFTSEEFKETPNKPDELRKKLELIKNIHTFLANQGVGLAVVLVPAKARIYEEHLIGFSMPKSKLKIYNKTLEELRTSQIYTPDLTKIFLEEKASKKLYYTTDTHWNKHAVEIVGENLAKGLVGYCPGLELGGEKYQLSYKQKNLKKDKDLRRFIPMNRVTRTIEKYNEKFEMPSASSQSGLGLFDERPSNIALIGTSYSKRDDWDASAILKHKLGADILNLADEGQGPVKPMLEFIKKTDWNTHNYQLVIWEFPERFLGTKFSADIPEVLTQVKPDYIPPCMIDYSQERI